MASRLPSHNSSTSHMNSGNVKQMKSRDSTLHHNGTTNGNISKPARSLAAVKPLQSTNSSQANQVINSKQEYSAKVGSNSLLQSTQVDTHEVCNEKTTTTINDMQPFDFTSHMKSVRPTFNRFGQHEPATVRIRNIITQYVGDSDGCGVEELIKELMQNSDDAGATEIHFVLDKRHLPKSRVWEEWKSMQGPALCVHNNSVFTDNDIESIQKLGVGSKSTDPDKTGQFGIGFNVVYQITDCPILLSDHKDICLFDPHLKYVPGACDERPGGHVDLRQDGNFAKLFPDFMAGFLRGQVEHAGCTVFRFPLRLPNTESQICDMTFGVADVDAIEEVFQSVDFRMFLHSALLFTKNLCQVKVSSIKDDGKIQTKVQVSKLISSAKLKQLQAAQQRLSHEMRRLLKKEIKPQQITKFSISYNMQTEDDYLKNDWFINQTFGFHGALSDQAFLESFYGEESKRFLPVAGVATKINSTNMVVSHAYSFLPLPIQSGLPVHINGHFAIHSSRRSIWEHTSFGKWNTILRNHVIAPSYGHFLVDFSKTFKTKTDLKQWMKLLPEAGKAKDDFFLKLVQRTYKYAYDFNLLLIPVPASNQLIFHPAVDCLFVTSIRNECVENVLLKLNHKICTAVEVGLRFKMAQCDVLSFLNPEVVIDRLKSSNMELPSPVNRTPFMNIATIKTCVEYIMSGQAGKDYKLLAGVPLLLTCDGILRLFSTDAVVYPDSEYAALMPEHAHLFLHEAVSELFKCKTNQKPTFSPVKPLDFLEIAKVLRNPYSFMDLKWVSLFWKLVKERVSRSDVSVILTPCSHLPLLPLSDRRIVSLTEGAKILTTAEASKNMQMVIETMGMLRLDCSLLDTSLIAEKDAMQLATPFMLNAALPSAFLSAIRNLQLTINSVKEEHCEIILQYLSLDTDNISNDEQDQITVKSLPIFEDVDGSYKKLVGSQGVILDSCIPTHGVAEWMEKSNCLLLKEKVAYSSLYEAIGLVKKNAVEVYLDDIFPNFPTFDEELRMSHLTSLRSSIVPLLEAYADTDTQTKFWDKLKALPCIPFKSELLPVSRFRDPEKEVLNLLANYYSLPLSFTDDEWLPFFRKAGLKQDLKEEDLLECAEKVATLSTAEFSEHKAKLVLEAACNHAFSDEALVKLCQIRFIPQESIPVDETLLQLCPPVVHLQEYICLRKALVYENDKDRHIFRHSILCWSVLPTLPKWVELTPHLAELAEVKSQPSVTAVCQHIKNLTGKLPDKPSLSAFKSYRKVICYCLDFLQNPCKCMKKRCDDCAILRSLKDIPFICVKNRNLRVRPPQIILYLPSDMDADVLYPYVFSRPSDMAKYDDLLRHVGALQSPSPDMYAEILHSLWLEFGSTQPLQTNDKQTAGLAVYGLFTTLLQQGQRLTTCPLCLPSDKALMSLSTELIVADNESLVKTLKDRNYQFVCSLSSCNLSKPAKDLIFYLPESVRPKLLSQLVTEQAMVDSPCDLSYDCPFYNQYYNRVHSDSFRQAIWLIARVSEDRRAQFSNDLGRLKLIDVICFNQLSGYLCEKGRILDSTRTEKTTHLENTLASSKLYVQHSDSYPGHAALVNEVASAIKSVICYNENFYIDTGSLVELLHCQNDEDIQQYLIEQGLNNKEDDMSRPKPGTMIPNEARELFMYDPDVTFQPKEYVGYCPKNSDDMIYARIIRESERTEGEDIGSILREYDLDTGRGYTVQASAMDLFKESRRQSLDQHGQLVTSSVETQPKTTKHSSAIIEEAKRTVTKVLEEVYSDPTLWRQRDKIKKMMLLKWHPDKSANSLLATEVFKHVKLEIDRVEQKYNLSDDEDVEETEYEWEESTENKETTNNNVKKENAPSNCVSVSDMACVNRWLEQANHDYSTALHLQKAHIGYEWVCHICCEVIRKVMVAAIAARSPLTLELESTRFTNKLYDALSKLPGIPEDLPIHLLELNKLKVDETTTRQLSVHGDKLIPSQVFNSDVTDKVVNITDKIKDSLTKYIKMCEDSHSA